MRTVIGLLSDAREAKRTADDLKKIGARDISIISKDGSSSGPLATYLAPSGASAAGASTSALESMGLSRVEAQRYLDGLRSGYTLEAATIEDDKAEQALAIMKQHALNFEGAGRTDGTGFRAGSEAILPVIAEELRVGKREVEAGGVRVTSTVQEVPVQEQVQLREEKVDVERRAVNRPIAPGDAAFKEQAFEVRAKAEEAVVAKEARVVEEVVVRKGEEVHTQNISDTVRRQDVNVEQLGTRYHQHFQQNFAQNQQAKFDEYAPAYQYGYDLRGNKAYSNRKWDDIEPNVRADWEKKQPGTWERFKGAVRHAWEDVKT
jgi:uncharacterized protein (TIGR02271 family)